MQHAVQSGLKLADRDAGADMLSCPQLRSCTCFCRLNSSSCARNLGSSNVFASPGFRDFIVFEKHDVKVHERLDSDDCGFNLVYAGRITAQRIRVAA